MNFTSPAFAVFLLVTMALFYLPWLRRWQLQVLVAASLYFYAFEFPYLLILLLLSCAITTVLSRQVMRRGTTAAKPWLWAGVVLNLGILLFFKYKFLVVDTAATAIAGPASVGEQLWRGLLMLPLPIGISFYTFHGISLLVDAYRRRDEFFRQYQAPTAAHGWNTLLYLTFFPQLISGPIVKARDFYPQIVGKRFADIDWAAAAHFLILGFFLKTVVADNLQQQTFWMQNPYFQVHSTLVLLVLLLGYSAQIFADFAGYSLIAIGLGLLFGYRLLDNFNFPYISSSLAEFWRRWHISLSSWLRDYLYIPLGGNQYGAFRTYVNLIIVMFLGGLWHGAHWSFAVWGLWHGIGLALERPWTDRAWFTSRHRGVVLLRVLVTFGFVTLGWLLFKLQNFSEALLYLHSIAHNGHLAKAMNIPLYIVIFALPVLLYHLHHVTPLRWPLRLRQLGYAVMLTLILLNHGPAAPFVYFQF